MGAEYFENSERAANLPDHHDGFLSYARVDDQNDYGRISYLRTAIQREFQLQTNHALAIFQDVEGIRGGDDWEQRVDSVILETQALIPVMTPAFFASKQCRSEVERFAAREDPAARIIPIYYVEVPDLESSDDPLKMMLQRLNYVDFREVRLSDHDSSEYRRVVAKLVGDIADGMGDLSSRPPVAAYEPGTVSARSAVRSLYVLQTVVGDAGPAATVQYRLSSMGGLDLISYPVELREGFFNVTAAFGVAESDAEGRHCMRLAVLGSERGPQVVTLQILGLPEHCDAAVEKISADLLTGADSHGRVIIRVDIGAGQVEDLEPGLDAPRCG